MEYKVLHPSTRKELLYLSLMQWFLHRQFFVTVNGSFTQVRTAGMGAINTIIKIVHGMTKK